MNNRILPEFQEVLVDEIPADVTRPHHNVLVVEDDAEMLTALSWYFQSCGFEVAAVGTIGDAKQSYQRLGGCHLVVADYYLPDGNGGELLRWMRDSNAANMPFLMISGLADAPALEDGMAFLAKPFSLAEFEGQVASLLGAARGGSALS